MCGAFMFSKFCIVMNKLFTIILSILFNYTFLVHSGFAQNLVPNPSFEVLDSCPDGSSQIDRATGWIPFTSSPDFLHECGITFNQFQCQNTGKGKARIINYREPPSSGNEIMGIELSTPLVIGEKYYVSFKAKLQISSSAGINKLGAIFTIKKYCYSLDDFTNMCDSTPMPINNNWAHIVSNDIITDTANWTTIFGSFIADSAYRYIAIGHFFDRMLTDTIMVKNMFSILPTYFIDDICVSNDSLTCIDITTEIIDFQADSIMIQEDSCVNFIVNTVVDYDLYQWQFPGAVPVTSTDSMPTNICYDSAGIYSVILIASTNKGCADTIIKSNYITVICPNPVSLFTFTYIDSLLTVSYSDSSSNATNWLWDFGDGSSDTVQNPIHSYSSSGTYNTCLVISNACSSDTLCDSVTVSCPNPVSLFSYSDSSLTVNFIDSTINPASWMWNFGDGQSDTVQNPIHTYDSGGDYNVCLIASNTCGTDTFCQTISITGVGIQEKLLVNNISIYPNPITNEYLKVSYELTEKTYVKMRLIDYMGKEIAVISSGYQPANRYQERIYTNDLSSGLYFFIINIGGKIQIDKIVKL